MPSGYAGIWALFTDWCAVTETQALPADPATVAAFLAGCPAAPATLRRRVAAIDHHHTATGHPPPGKSTAVLAAPGRPTGEPRPVRAETTAAVEAALRGLPSHGWTQGMFGRRDRCLLVLSQLAGVPYQHLATLTAGDITIFDSGVTIRPEAGNWLIRPADDGLLCGGCAILRWLEVLQVAATRVATAEVARLLKTAPEVTGRSPHACQAPLELAALTRGTPLLSPIDQWGALPFPPPPLTPHSLSRRVRDLLAGDLGAHRDLPVDTDDGPKPAASPPPPVPRAVYSREDSKRAWARRRADLADLAGVDDLLRKIDARAEELQRRTAEILAEQNDPKEPDPRYE